MSRVLEQIMDVIGDMVKLFFMAWFVIMMLLYGALNIVAHRAVSVAEAKGVFLQEDVRRYLTAFHIDEALVTIDTEPSWGVAAEFLGAPIGLELTYNLNIPVLRGTAIPMALGVKKVGISQAYPGYSGYGSYDLEGAGP